MICFRCGWKVSPQKSKTKPDKYRSSARSVLGAGWICNVCQEERPAFQSDFIFRWWWHRARPTEREYLAALGIELGRRVLLEQHRSDEPGDWWLRLQCKDAGYPRCFPPPPGQLDFLSSLEGGMV